MFASLDEPLTFLVHDITFHRAIAHASHNPILASLIEMVSAMFYERARRNVGAVRDLREAAEMHRAIYQALRDHDGDAAQAAMSEHLRLPPPSRADAGADGRAASGAAFDAESGPGPRRPASLASDVIRHVGILGGGNITDTHARAAAARCPISRSPRSAAATRRASQALAARHGAVALHRRPGLPAAPPPRHRRHRQRRPASTPTTSKRRRAHGLHVLCEKPLDVSTARIDRMLEAVGARRRHARRLLPGSIDARARWRVKDALVAGRLGRPMLADARVKWYRPPEYYAQSRWRGTWALDGGGALMNQGIHTVDLLLWLLGDVRRVYARTLAAHARDRGRGHGGRRARVRERRGRHARGDDGGLARLRPPGRDHRHARDRGHRAGAASSARDLREPALEGAAGGAAADGPVAGGRRRPRRSSPTPARTGACSRTSCRRSTPAARRGSTAAKAVAASRWSKRSTNRRGGRASSSPDAGRTPTGAGRGTKGPAGAVTPWLDSDMPRTQIAGRADAPAALKTLGAGRRRARGVRPCCPTRARRRSRRSSRRRRRRSCACSPRPSTRRSMRSPRRIIPADAHSPGAHAARVADYVDLLLSESDQAARQAWTRRARRRSTRPPPSASAGAVRQGDAGAADRPPDRDQPATSSRRKTPVETLLPGRQGRDHPRLLHVRDRASQGSAVQGQPVPRRVRRLYPSEHGLVPRLAALDQHVRAARPCSSDAEREREPLAAPSSRRPRAVRTRGGHHSRAPQAVRRHRRRLGSGRRHGRLPAGHRRRQGAAARGRTPDRHAARNTGRWSGRTRRCGAAGCRSTSTPLNAAEYNMLDRPYGTAPQLAGLQEGDVVLAATPSPATGWSTRSRTRPTGTPLRVGAGARPRRQDQPVGPRVAAALGSTTSRRKSRDGFGEDWPIGYADLAPYYDKVDLLLGISGTKENLPQLPDSIFQRPVKLNCGEMMLKHAIAKMGRHLIPGRAGVTTDGRRQQVPEPLRRPRPLRAGLRPAGADALADGADLPGPRHRQPHASARTRPSPKCWSTGRRARRQACA